MDVAEIGDVMNHALLARQQGRRQNRKRRILGTADSNRAGESGAAVDENFIHLNPALLVPLSEVRKEKSRHSLVVRFATHVAKTSFHHRGRYSSRLALTDFEGDASLWLQVCWSGRNKSKN